MSSTPKKKAGRLPPPDWADDIIDQCLDDANDSALPIEVSRYADTSRRLPKKPLAAGAGDAPSGDDADAPPEAPPREVEDPAVVLRRKKLLTGELSVALAELLGDWLKESPDAARVKKYAPYLPLYKYDDTEFDLKPPGSYVAGAGEDGVLAACYTDGAWTFSRFVVLSYDESTGLYQAQDTATTDISSKRRVELCFAGEDRFAYVKRLTACLLRRTNAEALIKYHYIVQQMPVESHGRRDDLPGGLVTSSMLPENSARILGMALAQIERKQDPLAAKEAMGSDMVVGLLQEAVGEYEITMNRVVFDMNMLNASNIGAFSDLSLPPVPKLPPVKKIAVVPGCPPRSAFNKTRDAFLDRTCCTSVEVINALVQTAGNCIKIQDTRVLACSHAASMTLQKFQEMENRTMMKALRSLKDDWPQRTAAAIRTALADVDREVFNTEEGILKNYLQEGNMMRKLMARMNYTMSDTLYDITADSIREYAAYVLGCSTAKVTVKGTNDIEVELPAGKDPMIPPLIATALQRSAVKHLLNQDEIDKTMDEIRAWRQSDEGKKEGAICPIAEAEPVFGYIFEYSAPLDDFVSVIVGVFDKCIEELQGIPQVQKYVMERIFWPQPALIASIAEGEAFVKELRTSMSEAVNAAKEPLQAYMDKFQQWADILNIDIDAYLGTLTHVKIDEEHSKEGEEPLFKVDLDVFRQTLDGHEKKRLEILTEIPEEPISCGLFNIDTTVIRDELSGVHQEVIDRLLEAHMDHGIRISGLVQEKYAEVLVSLSMNPQNIEEVAALKETMDGVKNATAPLEEKLAEMQAYFNVHDDFKFRISAEANEQKWTAVGWPKKIDEQILEAQKLCDQCVERYHDEMLNEQEQFLVELDALEQEVTALDQFTDFAHVTEAARRCKECEEKLASCTTKAQLFNSREGLFESDSTDYDQLGRMRKTFEPFNNLWGTASSWSNSSKAWLTGDWFALDGEGVEAKAEEFAVTISKAAKFFDRFETYGAQANVAQQIKAEVDEFKPKVPLVLALRNQGMRERHWEQLSDQVGFKISPTIPNPEPVPEGETPLEPLPNPDFSLQKCLDLNLLEYVDQCTKVSEQAAREFTIEQTLDGMEGAWSDMDLDIFPYRDTGTGVLKGVDEVMAVLDEQVTLTQAMMFSAFKGPFEQRIDDWNHKLFVVSEVLESWLEVQRNWMYLSPIFDSPDINKQLPAEGKKFATVDKNWKQTISATKHNKRIIVFCANEKLLEKFKTSAILLDQVQKGLNEYLETKRGVFARFYFLSNDDLLSILSESKDVLLVQPHLKKCFEAINAVKFEEDLTITEMISPEKEKVRFSELIDPKGKSVEVWMLEVEAMMMESMHDQVRMAIEDYNEKPRTEWMQIWPSMCVLNCSQFHWTKETEEFFEKDGENASQNAYDKQAKQILDMVTLVQSGTLSKPNKMKVGALCVVDVHARDVMLKLAKEKVCNKTDFGWASQLRYYYDDNNDDKKLQLMAEMVAARRPYGYEYLGNSFRLVITPLTDKCYLTLMGALQMKLGGAPAGPAGTGKTETTKDLAKALAMQCVVFNCSDGLDYQAMGKFFKGLASCGAWACFDEFNRINIEVLSVIGQQISSIQLAIAAKQDRMIFEDSDIKLKPGFGVFITMNPGYAGRSALPDSLQALFRPVAMMVPDYALIGEIMFIAFGFVNAKKCGAKMVTTFRLCSEQCSLQPHYDYGMRAVKTVITAAGNLKAAEPEADEMVLLLRALMDVNNPKFLAPDLPLFKGIISDLFPGMKKPDLDYGDLNSVMKLVIEQHGLQPHPWFIMKVIQLYEMIVVRHGLMLVGPTGGGKTSNLHVLRDTLTGLKEKGLSSNEFMQKVIIYQLNPKSITMGQMYGAFDENTREWQDGIMSTMYRKCSSSTTPDRKWVVFNGPVDAIWIENMNTVLDDNKKLCLVSGETIKMSLEQTMMFEVMDLLVASPATVSRVGIIYMEPEALGNEVLVISWVERLPKCFTNEMKSKLLLLCEQYLHPGIGFLRTFLKEQVPTVNNNLVQSLERILDCYFEPFHEVEGREPMTKTEIKQMEDSIESLFIFAFVWSIGATTDHAGRNRFSNMVRAEMLANGVKKPFPKKGDVYDYIWDMEKMGWKTWMETTEEYVVDSKLTFSELVVPTTDSVRNTYLLDLLLMKNNHILMVGETGTGKTVNIAQYLSGASKSCGNPIGAHVMPYTMTFSAQTSANMTQDMLDGRIDKRKRGVFGPPAGKKLAVYVDDLNMPKRETYGAQPPIEILRQWFDQAGWYDRSGMLELRNIVDLLFIGSMGPPGGGRQEVTPRFLRHFNIVGYVEMSNHSKATIFETILQDFLKDFSSEIQSLRDPLTETTIEVFDYVVAHLLPTPLKSHYMFNLRDLAKVFQGLLMGSSKFLQKKVDFLQLWVHEAQRVFEDRMVTKEDHQMFEELLGNQLQKHFNMDWGKVVGDAGEALVFGDYMNPDVEPENRVYNQITEKEQFKTVIEDYLADHNANSKQPMPLVMFTDAIMHVSTIARVLRQPGGNALLLGVGGSGRQSLTRLASHLMGYTVFQVTIQKGYGVTEWRDDLRKVLLMAGVKNKPTTFLFSDVQIIMESMVEDINNILNAADVPNIYGAEELDQIQSACRSECTKKRIQPTKMNIFNQYIIRVKKNLHVCVCMSPLGDVFRARLLNFPSLVNCCTIDWFTEWPAEALTSVGGAAMAETDLGLGDLFDGVVSMFSKIHLTVQSSSKEFFARLRRRVYVTPTSYLELLSSFKSLITMKRDENNLKRKRLQIGLDKLASTKEVVSTLSDELEELMPQLVVKAKEVGEMMVDITAQKAEAEKIKAAVEIDEAKAQKMAEETQAIADSAQADLDEALPALAAATKCLDALSPADITEIKQFTKVGAGVELTMKVVCIYFGLKPEIDKVDGKKVENYHKASKGGLINDPKKFITQLKEFDKDNIPDKIIKKVAPFMEGDEFLPEKIKFASVACEAVCMWARAMYKYHFVALGVEPKRIALAEAKATLEVVMSKLAVAQAKLKEVVDNLDRLEAQYNGAVEEKAGLEAKEKKCKVQLSNADKLIGGLGGEEKRWKETVTNLTEAFTNLTGDVLVSAGAVSYLGPFTADFRVEINSTLQQCLVDLNIPHTKGADMQSTLVEPVKQRHWQLCSLPTDSLSTQNAIMMDKSRRWSLLVDPQGQANRYIKAMGKDKDFSIQGIDVTKLSDKNFLRTLENGIRFGKWVVLENIAEELDAALEPILLQQKFKSGGQDMMKIGDNNVPYSDTFRFFMTTKLPNPHYPPEIQVKVTLINFTVTPTGLEEQLLATVVEVEMPDLAEKKGELVVANAAMNKQLFDIETDILQNLANAEGNILDNTELIETLAQAKQTSEEVKAAMAEAEVTTQEILETSEQYRPVAFRASILYFCIAELFNVDPMYQYALPWFKDLFISGVEMAPQASEIAERGKNINAFFTYKLYCNICRSLFERHKLLFSFLMCIKILQGDGKIDAVEYRFLISGISGDKAEGLENPTGDEGWVTGGMWNGICAMAGVHALSKFPQSFAKNIAKWKKVFDGLSPHTVDFPEPYEDLSPLQRMCVIRCLRQDKTMDAMQKFVIDYMGQKYVEPPPFDLKACYEDSGPVTPLVFVLSTGSDPFADLKLLAEELGFMDTLKAIALGQGQGPIAERYITDGIENGGWVLLQNCHLCVSWMPTLEKFAEDFDINRTHQDFRLWLTSMPSKVFPVGVLQMSVKMTKEPPAGIKAQLNQTYIKMNDASLMRTNKPAIFRKMLFGLNLFHALVVERKKYGALGWNIPYTFNETDLTICQAQLEMYVDLYDEVPYTVLQMLTSLVNYGGRITDDKDMRTADIIVASCLQPATLEAGNRFSRSGIYKTIEADVDAPHKSYMDYIESLPLNAEPEIFGMHENASITSSINEAESNFQIILSLQPRTSGGAGASREDQIGDVAKTMEKGLRAAWDEEQVKLIYPTDYDECLNTTLTQEVEKFNRLIRVMHSSLKTLQLALKGLVVLSVELDAMGTSLYDQNVPDLWTAKAPISLKRLNPWYADLQQRLSFIGGWIDNKAPPSFWISGFFFPQGFMTACLQNYARKYTYPIDTVSNGQVMKDEEVEEITVKPEDGCFVYGLFSEGARWDKKKKSLVDPRPKELFTKMPVIHLTPVQHRETTPDGIYRCPVYKVLSRTGTLSTTGHSTNFVFWLEIPSNKPTIYRATLCSETNEAGKYCDNDFWVKGGVACFCALRD